MDRSGRYRFIIRDASEQIAVALQDAPAGSGDTPYLDALVLMGHAASLTTEALFARMDDPVPGAVGEKFGNLVRQRCAGSPVSYIRGFKEFYGREFAVGPGVLVPRPDTELLVAMAVEEIDRRNDEGLTSLHDCCTGTGCIAVTISLERSCTVTGSDISADALAFAERNAGSHQAPVEFWNGDLLEPLQRRISAGMPSPHIITANPPYVTDNEVIQMADRGWPEPALALKGGTDGLATIKRLTEQAASCLANGGCFMVEHGALQGPGVTALLRGAGFENVESLKDLAGHDRVCIGRWYKR